MGHAVELERPQVRRDGHEGIRDLDPDLPEVVREPADAVRLFRRILPDYVREHLLALYLGGRHRPVGWRVVATGTADQAMVHPREVFQPAILLGATAVIVAHNHPSGEVTPSREDWEVADRLQRAGEKLGIRLFDSLVFNESGRWARVDALAGKHG